MAKSSGNLYSCSRCNNLLTQRDISGSKWLPCLHVLCVSCFNSRPRANIDNALHSRCPTCACLFKEADVSNYFLLMNRMAESRCSCPDKAIVQCYCPTCKEVLCSSCESAHRRVTATKDHALIGITVGNCSRHPHELLQQWCQTCSRSICRQCHYLEHNGHEMIPLQIAAAREREQLQYLSTENNRRLLNLRGSANVIQTRLQEVDVAFEKGKQQLFRTIKELSDQVTKKGKYLLETLEAATQQKKNEYKRIQTEQESVMAVLSRAQAVSEEILKCSNPTAIMNTKDKLKRVAQMNKNDFNNLQTQPQIQVCFNLTESDMHLGKMMGPVFLDRHQFSYQRPSTSAVAEKRTQQPTANRNQPPPSQVASQAQKHQLTPLVGQTVQSGRANLSVPTSTRPPMSLAQSIRPMVAPPVSQMNSGTARFAVGDQHRGPLPPNNSTTQRFVAPHNVGPSQQEIGHPRLTRPQMPAQNSNQLRVQASLQVRPTVHPGQTQRPQPQGRTVVSQASWQLPPQNIPCPPYSTANQQHVQQGIPAPMSVPRPPFSGVGRPQTPQMPPLHRGPVAMPTRPQQSLNIQAQLQISTPQTMQPRAQVPPNQVPSHHPAELPFQITTHKSPVSNSVSNMPGTTAQNESPTHLTKKTCRPRNIDEIAKGFWAHANSTDASSASQSPMVSPPISVEHQVISSLPTSSVIMSTATAVVTSSVSNLTDNSVSTTSNITPVISSQLNPVAQKVADIAKLLKSHSQAHSTTNQSSKSQIESEVSVTTASSSTDTPNNTCVSGGSLPKLVLRRHDDQQYEPNLIESQSEQNNGDNGRRQTPDASLVTTTNRSTTNDGSEDYCAVCHQGCDQQTGDLFCCDGCPKVYHAGCHVPSIKPNTVLPDVQWFCTFCRKSTSLTEKVVRKRNFAGDKPDLSDNERLLCETILLSVMVETHSQPFQQAVNRDDFPMYYKIIRSPMDLSKVKRLLKKNIHGKFRSIETFIKAMNRVFKNCSKFNPPNTEMALAGQEMLGVFRDAVTKYLPAYDDQVWEYECKYVEWSDESSEINSSCDTETTKEPSECIPSKRQRLYSSEGSISN